MSPVTLALESALAIMLGACLFYFWRLDRKLNALRTGQDGIRAAAAELVQASAQAEAAVRMLKLTAAEAGRDLQARINDARQTADRLGLGAGRMRSSGDVGARTRL
jgi:F0F1-type ATP synthase membrane subunit b/b'